MKQEFLGHTYEIYRKESVDSSPFENEIYLEIDGEKVTSATKLEEKGYDWEETESWQRHLDRYARAYIKGMEESKDRV